ncbi:MAG: DUF4339 domain-containing protein [Parachlamydiaceae bacterium]|nr:DUF4339 domain-containing protein [Parachlamydiaceae bacterium]
MKKTWYIKIRGKQKGPYTLDQLKRNREVTPDTLVWSPEFEAWIPIRNIPELQEIFKDPVKPKKEPGFPEEEEEEEEEEEDGIGGFLKKPKKLAPELVLEFQSPPPITFFWFWIALAILALFLLHILNDR